MLSLLKQIWKRWKRLAHGINAGISWVLMALTYVLAVAPVALWFKLLRRDLTDRGNGSAQAPTAWRPLPPPETDVRRVQRPW